MTDLELLMDEWKHDSKVDDSQLSEEVIKTANLHSKYLNILIDHKLKSRNYDIKYNKEKLFKWEYYTGKLNSDPILETKKLEPIRHKIMKSDIQQYLDADQELINISLKKMIEDEIVAYCEEVIKALKNRSYDIQSAVKWNIFQGGG